MLYIEVSDATAILYVEVSDTMATICVSEFGSAIHIGSYSGCYSTLKRPAWRLVGLSH